MSRTWEHPELGTFEWDCDQWVGRVEVPAWSVYKRHDEEEGLGAYLENVKTIMVGIQSTNEDSEPSDSQIEALLSFIKHSPKLVDAVIDTLWKEFQGEGAGSGYWWFGNLDQVNENAEYDDEAKPIQACEDIRDSLTLSSLGIGYQHETAVEITFSAWWEEEHGVGVLVHEGRVIGVGYQLDVAPFDKDEPSFPKWDEKPVINPFTGKSIEPKE